MLNVNLDFMSELFYTPKYFNTCKNTADYGRRAFFLTLYHEMSTRKGFVVQSVLKAGECLLTKGSSDLGELTDTEKLLEMNKHGREASYYTTVNVFSKARRTSENLRYRTAFFLDIDIHDKNDKYDSMLNVRKDETIKVLEQAFDEKTLPIPTMITDTGRGFALYYVLKTSVANVPRAKKIRSFFDLVYAQLVKKANKVLSAANNPMVGSVDTKVCDASRLCRIPGTYNSKADEMCRMSFVQFGEDKRPVYFEIGDIASFVLTPKSENSEKKEKEKRAKNAAKKTRAEVKNNGLGFCYARMQMLDKLQELRGEKCVDDCREQMLFILYNTLVPVYGIKEAKERIAEFNSKFTTPLSEKELVRVPDSAENVIGTDGHVGFYKMTNQYIVNALHMTEEEIEATGLGKSTKGAKRIAKRNEKKAIFTQIEDLLRTTTSDIMTYAQIAELHNISEVTVKRFAKKIGISRHNYPCQEGRVVGNPESINSDPRSIVSRPSRSKAQPYESQSPIATCSHEQSFICVDDNNNAHKDNRNNNNADKIVDAICNTENNQEANLNANSDTNANVIYNRICNNDSNYDNDGSNEAAHNNTDNAPDERLVDVDIMNDDADLTDDDINANGLDNKSNDLFDVDKFMKAWEYRLGKIGWAGETLLKQIQTVVDIAGTRNWNVKDMAVHLNSNVALYANWEDTYIINSELEWLKKYLRQKRHESWNGPQTKQKRKKVDKSQALEADKVYEMDRRFFGITVKNYPWLDSRWLKTVMRVFRNESKTESYRINEEAVATETVDACFRSMTQADIIKLLEHLCNYNGKIAHPYSFVVASVYKMKIDKLEEYGYCYAGSTKEEEEEAEFWNAYFAENAEEDDVPDDFELDENTDPYEETIVLADYNFGKKKSEQKEELDWNSIPVDDDDDDEEEDDMPEAFWQRYKLVL